LGELDLAHVKVTNATDLEVLVDYLRSYIDKIAPDDNFKRLTVGVFRCVLDRTMSKKSAAVGTGAIAFSPLVDILEVA